MDQPTLLLLTTDHDVAITLAAAFRTAGYTLVPGRPHELGIDSLARTAPQVVLVQVGHHASDSVAFDAAAQLLGARVLLFSVPSQDPAYRATVAMLSARSPFPIVEFSGDPTPLLMQLAPLRPAAPPDEARC